MRGKLLLAVFFMIPAGGAQAACNTRAGYVSNQPLPEVDSTGAATSAFSDANGFAAMAEAPLGNAYDSQTLRLNMERDLDSLSGFKGRYTVGVPVLGMRMENVPGYDSRKHCNQIQPILYKPKIEHLAGGTIRASVDQGRFAITFDPFSEQRQWTQDADPSGRFFWIFPSRFGVKGLPALTGSYDAAFRREITGSARRRWIAEAYLDLAMRYYRLVDLNRAFPTGWRPTRRDLREAVNASLGHDCASDDAELICLASTLIEENEAAPPGDQLARAAFMVGDALLENSGISTGVRQLDFGGANDQARSLAPSLFKSVPGLSRPGYGYRRPVRTWDIDLQNRWFSTEGRRADTDLSRDEAKRLLLSSHAAFLKAATDDWRNRVGTNYPAWSAEEQVALALIGIDLENVSGYRLRMSPGARHLCDVLGDPTLVGKRSNAGIVRDQVKRVRNAQALLAGFPDFAGLQWSCLSAN